MAFLLLAQPLTAHAPAESEHRLANVIHAAEVLGGAHIFTDELDSLGGTRWASGGSGRMVPGHSYIRQLGCHSKHWVKNRSVARMKVEVVRAAGSGSTYVVVSGLLDLGC